MIFYLFAKRLSFGGMAAVGWAEWLWCKIFGGGADDNGARAIKQ